MARVSKTKLEKLTVLKIDHLFPGKNELTVVFIAVKTPESERERTTPWML